MTAAEDTPMNEPLPERAPDGAAPLATPPPPVPEPAPPAPVERFPGPPVTGPARRALMLEVATVLTVYWLPSLVSAATYLAAGPGQPMSLLLTEIGAATASLAACVFLCFVVWKSGEGFTAFGLGRPLIVADLGVGFVAFVIYAALNAKLWRGFPELYQPPFQEPEVPGAPTGPGLAVLGVAIVLNSVAEELAMRGYLMRRLGRLSQSWAVALFVPAILFGTYHMYQGVGSILVTSLLGCYLGALYWLTGRLWPGIVCHTAYNVYVYALWYGYIE